MALQFRDDPTPRYAQLADLFRQRIERGVWRRQERIPSLEALTTEFAVARVTVRQAVAQLSGEGLLSAERGRGTFVTGIPNRSRSLRLESSLAAIAAVYRGDKPELTLIDETDATPQLTAADGRPANKYRHLRRVHSRDGESYCVISIYLDETVFQMAPRRFRRETVVPVLLELPGIGIAAARQSLKVASADTEVARLLKVPLHSAVAEVRRVVTSHPGVVLYLGEVTYRGDYINFEMDLKV